MARKRVGRYSNEFRRMCVERMKQCDDIGASASLRLSTGDRRVAAAWPAC